MVEGAGPSATHAPPSTHPAQRRVFNPTNLLYNAISYGEAVWSHICHRQHNNLTLLVNLSYIIEDHLQNLIEIYTSSNRYSQQDPLIKSLITFYSSPELHPQRQHLICTPLVDQIHSNPARQPLAFLTNYFSPLYSFESEIDTTLSSPKMTDSSSHLLAPTQDSKSFYVEDLGVSEVSDIVRLQMDNDKQNMEENVFPPPPITQTPIREEQASQRLRINLIRHRPLCPIIGHDNVKTF
jgi:hypothetical protein